jgi:hypothetical protein
VVVVRAFLHGLAKVTRAQRDAHMTWLLRGAAVWQAELAQHSDLTERTNRSA